MSDALERASVYLAGWAGSGGGWLAEMRVTKPGGDAWAEEADSGVLPIRKRSVVEEKAQPGIRRMQRWSRSRAVVALPRTRSDSDVAAALAMARLSGPELPLLLLVCCEQLSHLPTVMRYAEACGLEPVATQDALERILWRRASRAQDARAKEIGVRAERYRRLTAAAEMTLRDWLDRAAAAFLDALKSDV